MESKVIIIIMIAIVEFAVAFEVYYKSNDKRKVNWWVASMLGVGYVAFAAISSIFIQIYFVDIVVSAMLLLALSFAFDIGKNKRNVIIVVSSIICMAIFVIAGVIVAIALSFPLQNNKNNENMVAVVTFVSKLLLLFFMQLLAIKLRDKQIKTKIWYSLTSLALPLATFIVLTIQSYLLDQSQNNTSKTLILISAGILTLSCLLALFLIEAFGNREKQWQLETFRMQELQKEKSYYQKTIEMSMQSNKAMHDLKHILFKLYEQGENTAEVKDLIEQMYGIATKANFVKYTALNGLNVLLNIKFNEIKDKNIEFEHHIFVSEQIKIDEIDLCVLFGNLFDNAIEAVGKCRKKFIKINVTERKEYFIINMTNSTINNNIAFGVTSKANKLQHGFGLQSVCDIADKYDGDVDYNLKSGVFEIAVMLKN